AWTIELWFKTPSSYPGGGSDLITITDIGLTSGQYIKISLDATGHITVNAGGVTAGPVTALSTSTIYYLVGTYDGAGTLKLYVNAGAPNTTTGISARSLTPQICRIGTGCKGTFDELAIYGYALSSTQITNHYNAQVGGSYAATILGDTPLGHWRLGESSSGT